MNTMGTTIGATQSDKQVFRDSLIKSTRGSSFQTFPFIYGALTVMMKLLS